MASLEFVDASGGGCAAMAAAIAVRAGRDATAGTTNATVGVPSEVDVVLTEIGLSAPSVALADAIPAGERIDVEPWTAGLYSGEGDLERFAAARIARDKIERRVEALIAGHAKR